MTVLNDRHAALRAISERDPLKIGAAPKTKPKPFKVGKQATTKKKKLPRPTRKARSRKLPKRHGVEEDVESSSIGDPYQRYHIPKTTCATHVIPVFVGEHEDDPAFNVSTHICAYIHYRLVNSLLILSILELH